MSTRLPPNQPHFEPKLASTKERRSIVLVAVVLVLATNWPPSSPLKNGAF